MGIGLQAWIFFVQVRAFALNLWYVVDGSLVLEFAEVSFVMVLWQVFFLDMGFGL